MRSRLFLRRCILRSVAKAPERASIVLVSLVYDFLFGRLLHDSVVVSDISQAVRQTVEIRLTQEPEPGFLAQFAALV
jgi:hypothetical protein